MKAILVLIVVVGLMVLFGWITFSNQNGDPAVILNSDTVQEDVDHAAETTRDAAEVAAEKGERLADEVRRTDIDVDVRRDPPPSDSDQPVEP